MVLNDGTSHSTYRDIVYNDYETERKYSVVTNDPPISRPGYDFKYWAFDRAGNQRVNGNTIFADDHNTLYAIWGPATFNITLANTDARGKNETMAVNLVDDIYLPDKTANGFTFLGWSNPNWTGLKKGSAALFPKKTTNTTYTANWAANSYTIRLTNLGTNDRLIGYNTQAEPITSITNPTRSGYTFKGWSGTGLTGDTNKDLVLPAYTYGNKTFTANWIRN
jgi:uncharacterized repeat protein (TIGR02543 family)